jgi:hypothetical protein
MVMGLALVVATMPWGTNQDYGNGGPVTPAGGNPRILKSLFALNNFEGIDGRL